MYIKYVSSNFCTCEDFVGFRISSISDISKSRLCNSISENAEYVLLGVKRNEDLVCFFGFSKEDMLNSSSLVLTLFDNLTISLAESTNFVDLNSKINMVRVGEK